MIIPFTIFSQEKDSTKASKFSIGLTFSPDYCYRNLKADASSQWIADNRNSYEIPKFGYTTGLNFSYRYNKRVSFGIGLLFSDKGEKTKNIATQWITPSGQPDPILPIKLEYNFHYYYLDIPLQLDFNLISLVRGEFYFSASFSPNIFLSQETKSYSEYSDGRKEAGTFTTVGYNAINLSFTAGIGYRARFSDKFFFKLEPKYRYSITSIIDAPIRGYLFSVGLDIGFYYGI